MRFLILLLSFLASPLLAQSLSSDYEPIGRMEMVIDGTPRTFHIATIPAKERSFAEIKEYAGQKMLTITGVSVNDKGSYARPMISLTISLAQYGPKGLMSVDYMEEGRGSKQPTEANVGTGSLDMQNFSLSENGEVNLDFTAELIRMVADENWELSPQEGMAPVSMSGHVSLTIPPEYRVGD
ncbi:hypothetical protein EI983_03970 [Roseovarius faecimaris]|uniref:Uncharacterized protein n=1 Tax=Roseovarius faecimaris TaxID=2494550 RepID=A0A6I6IXV3_9RHOB|nr:hypothetical protein [Roseovarius faecimaris]QGX97478.1 hypothetical protein EI983_03970 [Roseovarius faecimaris]